MRFFSYFIFSFLFIQIQGWTLGPFIKDDSVNPIMGPILDTKFACPIRDEEVAWEAKDIFNPAAMVKDGKVHILYRAEDFEGEYNGTSRIGLAVSDNAYSFTREKEPIFYPDNDAFIEFEWEGGVEDPRIVEDEEGNYVMTYTGYNGSLARLMVATTKDKDLKNWEKHGLAFKDAQNLWGKAGSIVCEVIDDKFIAKKINGKYWMYWGETNVFIASSDDLKDWTLKTKETFIDDGSRELTEEDLFPVFEPREGKFDSDIVEPGPPSFITDDGILLIYNGRNKGEEGGDPELQKNTYAGGQVLLDKNEPWKLLKRTENYFIRPDRPYEIDGQVNHVVFLEGLVKFKGKWHLYYGTADSKIAVATYTIGSSNSIYKFNSIHLAFIFISTFICSFLN